jgi:hypothetical protein
VFFTSGKRAWFTGYGGCFVGVRQAILFHGKFTPKKEGNLYIFVEIMGKCYDQRMVIGLV